VEIDVTETGRVKILVVDDNSQNILTLQRILEGFGYEIETVKSGKDALRLLLNQDFALILLDVNMPEMDGFETATLIRSRERTQSLPIIFTTAYQSDDAQIFRGYSLGAVDYLLTPFSPEILRAKVAVFVDLFRKSERVREQNRLLVEAESREHERRIAEVKQQLEIETLRLKEEHLRNEKELEARNFAALAGKAKDLEQSNSELEQFASVASHDLQEPLRTLVTYSQLLEMNLNGTLNKENSEVLQFIVENAKRMQLIIRDLLAFSGVTREPLSFQPVNCVELVGDVLKSLEAQIRESSAQIQVGQLPTVRGNAIQLTQVFINLIGNAIKFRGANAPVIDIKAEKTGSQWTFCVSDKGIGIDRQYFERIFVIFRRLHTKEEYPGNGIGLAMCKKIIERHGGRLWVESAGGGSGSHFYFTIPEST
jgi:signal transduction histidine kinase